MRLQAENFWRALDIIAHERGLTASALARKAGLDPTTFNRSKRGGLHGDGRWPSTSSIALVLEATGLSLSEFARIVEQPEAALLTDAARGADRGDPLPPRLIRRSE